jgi:hypothetical protein
MLASQVKSVTTAQGSEGKSRMEAMRCLKCHLARRYYRLLSEGSRSTSLLPESSLVAVLHGEHMRR